MKAYLQSKKITSGIINLGGNVLTVGEKSDGSDYTVGIQKPSTRAASQYVPSKSRTNPSSPPASTSVTTE